MAVIFEDIDSAPGCAYCRFRHTEQILFGAINRCKITWKRIDEYCDSLKAPSKPSWCPAKKAVYSDNNTYVVLDNPNIIEGEIIDDNREV